MLNIFLLILKQFNKTSDMKNKQSLYEINNNTKLLLIKNNLLKNQICDELRMNGTSNVSALCFKSAAERYRISLLRTFPILLKNIKR